MVNRTLTALSRCIPGIHLGMAFTTRIASCDKSGSAERTTFMELMLPSFSTTNSTNTFPPMPISAHLAGYLKFSLSHLFKSPLKRGIFSTIINGRSPSPESSPSSLYPFCQSVALPVKEPFVFSFYQQRPFHFQDLSRFPRSR